jgi:outer membrane protein assembly factor BamE (lipoprotein component of BamABCDE complex)
MKYTAILLMVFMAVTMGCAQTYTVGNHVDLANVGQITPGKTTADQVVSILGKPEKVEPSGSGSEKYIYYYYREKPAPGYRLADVEQERLEVSIMDSVVQRVNLVQQRIEKPNSPIG